MPDSWVERTFSPDKLYPALEATMAKKATPLKDLEPCQPTSEPVVSSSPSDSSVPASESEPTTSPEPVKSSSKTTKRRTRHQWWTAFEDEIVEFCIIPRLRGMMQVGVGSKSELIRQWELAFNYKPSSTQMNSWLERAGLLEIFDAPKTFRLPEPTVVQPQWTEPASPTYAEPTTPTVPVPTPPSYPPQPAPNSAVRGADPRFQRLPANLQRALGNLSERELADPAIVREALNLAAENPGLTPIVPQHVHRPSPYPSPPRTFMGGAGPVQMPPGATMPGMAPGSF